MQPDAAARTAYLWQRDEDAERRERRAADADAHSFPQRIELRAAASRTAVPRTVTAALPRTAWHRAALPRPTPHLPQPHRLQTARRQARLRAQPLWQRALPSRPCRRSPSREAAAPRERQLRRMCPPQQAASRPHDGGDERVPRQVQLRQPSAEPRRREQRFPGGDATEQQAEQWRVRVSRAPTSLECGRPDRP